MPPKPTLGFKWVVEAKEKRKAKLISVDPRFNRTSAVADFYAPIRNGTDIAFLGGVINYLLSHDKIHHEYVKFNTDATFLTKPGYGIRKRPVQRLRRGQAQVRQVHLGLPAGRERLRQGRRQLQDPACVLQQLKKHYSRYTPEMVSKICGTPQDKFLKVCEMLARCPRPTRP
jgi:formate dehydrogenase major subunit